MSAATVSVTAVAIPAPVVPSPGPVQTCSVTGLVLVRWPAKGTWRVFKTAYDPLSGRTRTSENPQDWNRFDLPGSATLYSSTEPQGAYAEVLASLRPRISELAKLAADVFDDVGEGTDPITEEWGAKGFMAVGNIPTIWHADRNIAQINVQSPSWYVDVEHPVSMQILRSQFVQLLNEHDIEDFDVSVIRGPNRVITCAVAEWVASLYLEDGSVPLGIRYNSRHSTDWECWASFPDTKAKALHVTGLVSTDKDLRAITKLFGLHIH